MPYHLPKEIDTPANNKKVEDCVADISGTNKRTNNPYTKSEKIAICKSQIMKSAKKGHMSLDNLVRIFFSDTKIAGLRTKGKAVKGVEILRTGTFKGFKITIEKMKKMVEYFKELKEKGILPNVPVRSWHPESQRDSSESIMGYFTDIRLKGDRLIADFEITEPDGFEKIRRGTLRSRSAEIGTYEDNDGNKYFPVILGTAFVDRPAVEGLSEAFAFNKVKLLNEEDIMDKKKVEKKQTDPEKEDLKEGAVLADEILGGEGKTEEPEKKEEEKKETEMEEKEETKEKEETAEMKDGKEGDKEDKEETEEIDKEKDADLAKITVAKKNDLPDSASSKISKPAEGSVKLSQKGEFVTMSKSDYEELKSYRAKFQEGIANFRNDFVSDLVKLGKILPAMEESEREFVLSLSDGQFKLYKASKENSPAFIELDKDKAETDSDKPKEEFDGQGSDQKKEEDEDKQADKFIEATNPHSMNPKAKK